MTESAHSKHPLCCPPLCSYCDSKVFSNSGVDEWSIIICTGCGEAGIHVRCYNKLHGGDFGAELAMSDEHYFCSEICQEVYTGLCKLTASSSALGVIGAKLHIFKGGEGGKFMIRDAIRVLSTSFVLEPEANGKTAVEMMCSGFKYSISEQNPEAQFDFSEYHVAVIRKRSRTVSAATFRVHGSTLACVAYLGTDPKYRKEGNATLLSKGLMNRLSGIGVKHLIAPSVDSSKTFWTTKLGFRKASSCEAKELQKWDIPSAFNNTTLMVTSLSTTSQKTAAPQTQTLLIPVGKPPVGNTEPSSGQNDTQVNNGESATKKKRKLQKCLDHSIACQEREDRGRHQKPESSRCTWAGDNTSMPSEPCSETISAKCTESAADTILLRFCVEILKKRGVQSFFEPKGNSRFQNLDHSKSTGSCTKCFLCGTLQSAKWHKDPLGIEFLCQSCYPKLVHNLEEKFSFMTDIFISKKNDIGSLPSQQEHKSRPKRSLFDNGDGVKHVAKEKVANRGSTENKTREIQRLAKENAILKDELLDCLRLHYRNQQPAAWPKANAKFPVPLDKGATKEDFYRRKDGNHENSNHQDSDYSNPLNDQFSEFCRVQQGGASSY